MFNNTLCTSEWSVLHIAGENMTYGSAFCVNGSNEDYTEQ